MKLLSPTLWMFTWTAVCVSRPFTLNYTAELMPNAELMEYICDNEQDAQNIDAPADAAIEAEKLLKGRQP